MIMTYTGLAFLSLGVVAFWILVVLRSGSCDP